MIFGKDNGRQCVASTAPLDGFGSLIVGKFPLPSELDAVRVLLVSVTQNRK